MNNQRYPSSFDLKPYSSEVLQHILFVEKYSNKSRQSFIQNIWFIYHFGTSINNYTYPTPVLENTKYLNHTLNVGNVRVLTDLFLTDWQRYIQFHFKCFTFSARWYFVRLFWDICQAIYSKAWSVFSQSRVTMQLNIMNIYTA